MNSYNSMTDKLKKTAIYRFGSTNISSEILTYAIEFDRLNDNIDEMLRECFISTACDYGISLRELVIGAVRDDLDIEKRRQMLTMRECININDFNISGIQKALNSFNVDSIITEYPSFNMVTVNAIGGYTQKERSWIKTEIEKIMPAHLDVQIIFNGLSWEEFDNKDITFSELDGKDMTWDEIDNFE